MSLQKRFKARYPKANFADFKTGDFFGKPNIFFYEGDEGEKDAVGEATRAKKYYLCRKRNTCKRNKRGKELFQL